MEDNCAGRRLDSLMVTVVMRDRNLPLRLLFRLTLKQLCPITLLLDLAYTLPVVTSTSLLTLISGAMIGTHDIIHIDFHLVIEQ